MSDLCKRLEEAAIKSLPPDGHEYDFLGGEDTLEGEAMAEITRFRGQRDKLLAIAEATARRIERAAFDIPPPNPYTPGLIQIAVSLRNVAIAEAENEP